MTTFTLNRRTLLTGTVALGTVGLLAACGGNSSKTESNALSAGDDLSKAVSYNEKERSALIPAEPLFRSRTAASCD